MDKNQYSSRPIDRVGASAHRSANRKLSLVHRKQIAAWKALGIIAFFSGLMAASIWFVAYEGNGQFITLGTKQFSDAKQKDSDVPASQAPKETDRIIVKFNSDKLPKGLTVAAAHANLEKAQGLKKLSTIKGINAYVYEISGDDLAREVVDRILADDQGKGVVEYVEVDMLVSPDLIPNDPLYPSQWHHPVVQTPAAWDVTQGERSIVVAILDSGINPNHEDLKSNMVPGWNFINNTPDPTDTVHGHGIKVAGTAAAMGNNSLGVSGSAPQVSHMPIRVADDSGYTYFSTMAQGLTYAADNGARVANMSFNGVQGSVSVENAANYLRSKGGVAVVSAGNTNTDTGYTQRPAFVVAAATAPGDTKASFSSFGSFVDVSAPGSGIYSTTLSGYGSVSGTSFSAPLTAGIYALMFSVNPALTPTQADNILFSTVDDLGTPGWDMYYGHGRVNAAKAVAAAKATIGTRDTVPPSVPTNLRTTSVAYNSVSLAWNAATDDNTGVAGYDVYRDGAKLTTVSGTTYTNTNLSPRTSYTYAVRAVDGAGNTSSLMETLPVTTPDTPFLLSSSSVTSKTTSSATVAATLTKPGTVIIQYGTSSTNLNLSVSSTTPATSHAVTLSNLAARTTYYYQVMATDGSTTVFSPVATFKTLQAKGKR